MPEPTLEERRDWRVAAALVILGPALLGLHTWVYSSTVDFTRVDAWRRLWSDLAQACSGWVQATYGPSSPALNGPQADIVARGLLLERIANQGLSPRRPLERVRKVQAFIDAHLDARGEPYDDSGRAVLLTLAFRVFGGIMPFLILWLGFVVATPVIWWIALEFWAAGRARAAALICVLLGLSPFFVECLALGRYPMGFYLAAVLAIIPLAVYGRLHPAPKPGGLAARVLLASSVLALCTFCRSSAAALGPGFVLAAWLGVCRVAPAWPRRMLLISLAALVLALPCALVPGAQQNDMWQPVWEGLGDFDRTHAFTWRDAEALNAVRKEGVNALWTDESEAVLRGQVVSTIRAEPGWYAGILVKRLLSTISLWRLWPWTPRDGAFIRESDTPNEGAIDKYWTYTTTADFIGVGNWSLELPVSVLIAPALLLGLLAWRGPRAAAAREACVVLACPGTATLILPVVITTAGGQEGQAIAVVYLFAAAFLFEVLGARRAD
jgi:hypothetical protein